MCLLRASVNLLVIQNAIMKLRFYTSVQDLLAHMLVAKNEMARIVGEFWQQFASLTGSY